jgi:mRNA interferase MazF
MVKTDSFIPQRGDVIWITLNPRAGQEQAGRRPAVTLSPQAYNAKIGLALLCPVTNQVKGYPYEVLIPPHLPISGAILSDQIKSLDWRVRKAEFICSLPPFVMTEVLQKLSTLL